jgi:hypothetical protein
MNVGPLEKPDAVQVTAYLQERLGGSVGFDVWSREESGLVRTDRDSCVHCGDVVQLGRKLASLHPMLSMTIYDLDRHAARAEEAGITAAPTMIVRGSGRSIRLVGLFSGMLFPALLDVIGFISHGKAPLRDETREALVDLAEVEIEAMLMPFDPYSAYMARVLGSLAAESRSIKLQLTELSEFPILAGQRSVSEIPLVTINGRRFSGAWDEAPLMEQIQRVLGGNDEPVVRERVLVTPYLSEEQASHLAQQQQAQQPPAGDAQRPAATGGSSGLIVPGR